MRSTQAILLGWVFLGLVTTGCALPQTVTPPPGRELAKKPAPIERRIFITSYNTQDGRPHRWVGSVEPLADDSLLFVRRAVPEHGLSASDPGARLVLAKTDVATISPRSYGGPVAAVILFGGA